MDKYSEILSSFGTQETLNPEIWDDVESDEPKLKPQIRKALLMIAGEFMDFLGDDLFVDDETTLRKETTIGYRNFSNDDFSYNLNVTASTNSPNSARFDGGIVITGSSTIIGNITASGQISSSATVRGQNIIAANQLQGNDLDIVTNAQIGGYLNTSGSVIFRNLSTTEPTVTGSLWISGSGIGSHSGSGYLMIFNP